MKGKKKKKTSSLSISILSQIDPCPPPHYESKTNIKKNTMKLRALIKIPQSIAQIVQQLNTYTFVYGLDIIGTHQ